MKAWIARDMDGELTQFEDCPHKYNIGADEDDIIWVSSSYRSGVPISPNLYPEITFENSPKLITI
jgi:hypothetical protein